jgi:hypothetical protein
MRFFLKTFATILSLFQFVIVLNAQNIDDIPKLREVKGKKLLEEVSPRQHKNGMWGYADNEGKFIIKPVFADACAFEGKIARVKVEDLWGTIGHNGLFIVTPKYDTIATYSSDSLAVVQLKGKYGLIDAKGKRIHNVGFDLIDYTDYGYRAKTEGKFGTISNKGVVILEPGFDSMEVFDRQRGLEHVCVDGKWGVLKDGSDLLTLAFDEKITFLQTGMTGQPDLYLAKQADKIGIVTSYGQFVAPCIYDEISMASSGQYYVTRTGDKYGAISLNMTELFAPILDSKPFIGEDIFRIHDDGSFYAVNFRGTVSFQDCADLYYVFKPDEYASTTSIPVWSKNALIEENLLSRQTEVDNAGKVVELMSEHNYDPAAAKADESMPVGYDLFIPANSAESYGIAEGGAFVKASGVVTDYESGHHNLHFKASTSSGLNVCLVSVPSTGEYLISSENGQVSLDKALQKFNVKKFSGIYPKDFSLLPDDRILVRFAFIRQPSEVAESLVETDQYYLPVESYKINLYGGSPNPAAETHAVITFSLDSLNALSFVQLPENGNYRMTASHFGGFYTHSSPAVIADETNVLKRYDRNGVLDWEYRPRYGEQFYDIEETENYIYLCGSTVNSSISGVEVPIVVQLSKRGARVNSVTKELKNSRFTGVVCKDHILYAKTTCIKEKHMGSDYFPQIALDVMRDNFGIRLKCVWEDWGDGVLGGCGLVDADGAWLNSPMLYPDQMCTAYDWEFGGFVADHLIVRHMGNYGLVNRDGAIVVETKYDLLEVLDNPNYVKASIGDSYGVLDVTGKVIVPIEYDYVGRMGEDIIVVRKDDKYGCFNQNGEMIVPLEYEEIREYVGGMARIRFKGKFGFIDKSGNVLVAPFSDEVENFSEDFTLVTIKNKVGFVNIQGDWLAVPMYDAGSSFSGGYAYLAQDGRYGYIDKSGEFVIPMNYSDAKDFDPATKLACVEQNGAWGVIDVKGNFVVPAEYSKVDVCADGSIYVEKDGKCGIFSQKGEEIFPVELDNLEKDKRRRLFVHGVATGRLDDQRVRIDSHGNIVYQYSLLTDR